MKNILIYGSRSFGQVVKNIVKNCNLIFAGFIDDYYTSLDNEEIVGPFKTVIKKFSPEEYSIINAIGYNYLKERKAIQTLIKHHGFQAPTLIHPKAYIDPTVKIGDGSIVMVNAVIDYNVILEDLVVVWPNVVINHDTVVKGNVFISPNATICGHVVVGENTFVGANATIVDKQEILPNSFIRAGSVYY